MEQGQASNTGALHEKNRASLVKVKPAQTVADQLGEEKPERRDLFKLDAYERDDDGRAEGSCSRDLFGAMILMRGICSVPEDDFAYFRRFPLIPAVVLSVVGSAELPSFSSFDYYPFEAVERLEEESLPGPSAVNFRSQEGSVSIRPCVVPEKSNAIIGVVTTGFEFLPPSCDGLTGSEDHGPMISPVDTACGYRG
ncbi:hypothetical protein F511_30912 [Dorcoceras hygrometricum]|uniref:Uncharacterized protein n=1 Tax=Dorcoceras hygrometricum TaxID=472368 RepID=A0A2Z7BEY8_9LAMI|nr:hypothetical protein F511_30912 [Dorcoceras hygrometricum]